MFICLTSKHFVLTILSSHMWSFSKIVSFETKLLLWRECCSFSSGECVRAGLAELKHWSNNATIGKWLGIFLDGFPQMLLAYMFHISQFAGSAWEALRHIRQAVEFLVYIPLEKNFLFLQFIECLITFRSFSANNLLMNCIYPDYYFIRLFL
jgi:hypothetical protein